MSNTTAVPNGRHPVNIGHLVMGLAFAGLLGVWALIVGDAVDGDDIRWLLPVPWVFAGAIGLLAVTLASRKRTYRAADEYTAAADATEDTTALAETTDPTETSVITDTTHTEEIR